MSLALLTGSSVLAMLLLDQPAQAHGIAQGGDAAGFLHPITGADHLLLLLMMIGVGAAASCIPSKLLLWGGAIGGGVLGRWAARFRPRSSSRPW